MREKKPHTDFSKILTELREGGYNDTTIAHHAGVEASTIYYLRRGTTKHPRYDMGVAIMELYETMKNERR